ncbi:DUF5103 domain-containing protein [Odoribacter lunatus]|uniref:type IX secretion system plug protein n=1 Tax=Odoribacter lunatus TaxID=2941335 RepID=UPI00203F449A|nr:DUF5103 domain-containing protein [Odoribacter lunatus]
MRFFLILVLLCCLQEGWTQPSYIKTIQCYPEGNPFSEPVIALGGNQRLVFAFDDLSSEINSYSYQIVHCDPDWNPSNLSSFSYLNGFYSNPLNNYNNSFNTQVSYTHFTLMFPNEDASVKLSGNYLLQIYNDDNLDSVVISQRFSVVENRVLIQASVTTSTLPQYLNTSQQLNFTVSYDNLPVYNPIKDVKVYVTQNQDPNSRRNFTPDFVRQNQLVYGNGVNNVFNGLAPFRNFDCSSLVYYTQYVKDVLKGPDGLYNFVLVPGSVYTMYSPLPNRDGNFVIQAENVNNSELEADYIIAHFAIYYPHEIPEAEVYIYGKFAGWRILPQQRMTYDAQNKAYVGEAKVKQGYYDYMYAVVPKGDTIPNLVTLQGNFYQTHNEYNIRCYVYDYNLGAYRFVGYQVVEKGF